MKKILLYLLGSFLWFVAVISAIVIWAKTEGDRILESTPPANAMERQKLDKMIEHTVMTEKDRGDSMNSIGDLVSPKVEK
jgi:hypothetical protein